MPLRLEGYMYLQEKASADVIWCACRHMCSIPEMTVMEESVSLETEE